ncbi:MAG TPA: rod-binding protein [Patescibacteria group bacterium]|nr:rod-binding protein [Patescibacteria group bacterium]
MTTLDTLPSPSGTLPGATTALGALKTTKSPAAVKKAAQDFEGVFISQMMQHMFDGIKTDQMFGGGQGEDSFHSMLIDEYAKQVVKKGGFGLSNAVMHTMLAEQEKTR